ncbi:MAG: DUF4390 domain-containing protein [Luteitalea sp.]|nr:DUF4390 domain-containing protein [Luteitalea sp.]
MRALTCGLVMVLGLLVAQDGSATEAAGVRVVPVAREGRVLVSFSMPDALTDELHEAIQSGLPTTFTYYVELRRTSAIWPDRLVASATIAVMVRYDNLTRRYQVTQMQDGRTEQVIVTEDAVTVRHRVTTFNRLPLFSTRPLRSDAEYSVRVRAHTRPRISLFAWPWDWLRRWAALGSAKFTFLP